MSGGRVIRWQSHSFGQDKHVKEHQRTMPSKTTQKHTQQQLRVMVACLQDNSVLQTDWHGEDAPFRHGPLVCAKFQWSQCGLE